MSREWSIILIVPVLISCGTYPQGTSQTFMVTITGPDSIMMLERDCAQYPAVCNAPADPADAQTYVIPNGGFKSTSWGTAFDFYIKNVDSTRALITISKNGVTIDEGIADPSGGEYRSNIFR